MGCQTLSNALPHEFKAVQIENKSNGICPKKLEGNVLIGENGMKGWVPVPLHGIDLTIWSEANKNGFISSGTGTGQYITKINFFLSKAPGYWVGVMQVLATEGRANGVCDYKVFAYKEGDNVALDEVRINLAQKRVNVENVNLDTYAELRKYIQTHKNNQSAVLGAIDSYSLNDSQRAVIKMNLK